MPLAGQPTRQRRPERRPADRRAACRTRRRLQAAIATRYQLPAWIEEDYARHKQADRAAAASEAMHVVGWSRHDIRHTLGIEAAPLTHDPSRAPRGMRPWQPWPPNLAAKLFLAELNRLTADVQSGAPAAAKDDSDV